MMSDQTLPTGRRKRKLAKTKWTAKMVEDLQNCNKQALKERENNTSPHWYVKQLEKLWMGLYPNSSSTGIALRTKLSNLQKQQTDQGNRDEPVPTKKHKKNDEEENGKQVRWSQEMLENLARCKQTALDIKEKCSQRGLKVSYRSQLQTEWLKLYPSSTLSTGSLCSRAYIFEKQQPQPDVITTKSVQKDSREKGSSTDSCTANMPSNESGLQNFYQSNLKHEVKPVFNALCYNCGMLLYARISNGHKFKSNKQQGESDKNAPVLKLLGKFPDLPFATAESWYACRLCKTEARELYPCGNPATGLQDIPEPLLALRNSFEKGQVAMCALLSMTLKKADGLHRIWRHVIGEVNVLPKLKRHYTGMYGFLVEKSPCSAPEVSPASFQRIKQAILCLRDINPLYSEFLAKVETLYRYSENTNVTESSNGTTDKKGKSVEVHLDQEESGWAIPFHNETEVPSLTAKSDTVGQQHPKPDTGEKWEEMQKVSYFDVNLEAKAWPVLFPYGRGSWKTYSILPVGDYIKLRLLNIDDRWRRDAEWSFFMYDRCIKMRIFYYNKSRRVQQKATTEKITAGDVKQTESSNNPHDQYGKEVPVTIPGSKSYWSSRLMDLLAMTEQLGQPQLFVTLTQNDNWPELQALVTGKAAEKRNELAELNTTPGQSCTQFSTEVVVAFFERLRLFRDKVLTHDGPLGNVEDYWYRIEYQKRGAIHVHKAVWCSSMPQDVVQAEMPRASDESDLFVKVARSHVAQYQLHKKCNTERCFKGPNKTVLPYCKYGFPFALQSEESMDDTGIRWLYVRREEEDNRVVPYNLSVLLLWNGHINIQKVCSGGWAMYLGKYLAKAEPTFDLKLSEEASDVEKYLRTRIVGRLEVEASHLGYHLCQSSRSVVFLPTSIECTYKILKRRKDLPDDDQSEDIFYDSLLDKYLDRPSCLHQVKYPDFVKDYKYCSRPKAGNDQDGDTDESNAVTTCMTDAKGRNLAKRKRQSVPRWRFHLPYGEEQDKYYEQLLLLNIPFTRKTIDNIISTSNKSKTYVEEAALRGILDTKEDALKAIATANSRGFSMDHMRDIGQQLVNNKWLSEVEYETILTEIVASRPNPEAVIEAKYREFNMNLEGDNIGQLKTENETCDLSRLEKTFSKSQAAAYEFITGKFRDGQQVLCVIVGAAGTGKSYLLNGIVQYCRQIAHQTVHKLATTGVAAHLIRGRTVHNFLRMDIQGNSYIERGTPEFLLVREANVLVIDEFSLLESHVLRKMDEICRSVSHVSKRRKYFGGKSILLMGDPCQLPAIGVDIFDCHILTLFTPIVLKEVKRQEDGAFVEALQHIRVNKIRDIDEQLLRSRITTEPPKSAKDLEGGAIIVSLRKERDAWNAKISESVNAETHIFQAKDYDGNGDPLPEAEVERLRKYHRERLPDTLEVKVGCRVVLLKNIDVETGWVNGTLSNVIRITDSCIFLQHLEHKRLLPLTRIRQTLSFKSGTYSIFREQFPICLGFALTTHKVQGMTLKKAYVNLNENFFASGQAYVALSRVKSIDDLHLLDYSRKSIILSSRMQKVLHMLKEKSARENAEERFCERVPHERVSRDPKQPGSDKHEDGSQNVQPDDPMSGRQEDQEQDIPQTLQVSVRQEEKETKEHQSHEALSHRQEDQQQDTPKTLKASAREDEKEMTEHQSQEAIPYNTDRLATKMIVCHSTNELNELVDANKNCVQSFLNDLSHRPNKVYSNETATPEIMSEIHPQFRQHYVAVSTPGDGNCLWHAVSLCLTGGTSLMTSLRLATVATLIIHNQEFRQMTESDALSSYEQVVRDAATLNNWGNEYHIQALAMALARPIIQYTGFKNSSGNFHLAGASSETLQARFADGKEGTRQHLVYNTNRAPSDAPRKPICIVLQQHHFTALLPKRLDSPIFTPATRLLQLPFMANEH